MALLFALKIVLLGVFIKKAVFATLLPAWAYVWVNSYAALISSCFWDTLIMAVIIAMGRRVIQAPFSIFYMDNCQ